MHRRTALTGAAATFVTIAALRLARAATPMPVFARRGAAIGGTDPVAYFTRSVPVAGDRAITHDWAGATWRFADAANRDAFAADPDAFAPRYGGYCAWAVAAKGALYPTRPENWSIEGGRLYLNYDDGVQTTWNADRAGFIREADRRWPEVAATA